MNKKIIITMLLSGLVLGSPAAFAKDDGHGKDCKLQGSYSYLYNGTSYSSIAVPFTETGSFNVDKSGGFQGEGTMTLNFSNFGGHGQVWLETQEAQTNGAITYDANTSCAGTISFFSTATVTKSAPTGIVPDGFVLIPNAARSVAFRISDDGKTVNLISTSPGTIASGTAQK